MCCINITHMWRVLSIGQIFIFFQRTTTFVSSIFSFQQCIDLSCVSISRVLGFRVYPVLFLGSIYIYHVLVLVEFSLSVSDFRTEKIFNLTKITCYTLLACVYAFICICVCMCVCIS